MSNNVVDISRYMRSLIENNDQHRAALEKISSMYRGLTDQELTEFEKLSKRLDAHDQH